MNTVVVLFAGRLLQEKGLLNLCSHSPHADICPCGWCS